MLEDIAHGDAVQPNAPEMVKWDAARVAFASSVIAGLDQRQKTLDCKYLYDVRGSALFDAICDLEEYYPTRTEIGILRDNVDQIADAAGPHAEMIELGSGASVKSRILLSALDRPARYLPVDIAASHMEAAAGELRPLYPGLEITPIAADFTQAFDVPSRSSDGQRLLFFPGSTIGNFAPDQAQHLLARLRRFIDADLFVIGVDLQKDPAILREAYNDGKGVTAAFNLNLLTRINKELDGNFDLGAFHHEARYVPDYGRIEMHLVSATDQQVSVAGRVFEFAAGETIHTENSHKFSIDGFSDLARRAGWESKAVWTDVDALFSVCLLRPLTDQDQDQ